MLQYRRTWLPWQALGDKSPTSLQALHFHQYPMANPGICLKLGGN
jgi:hypothetical protein